LLALTKPRITATVTLTTAFGLAVAPGAADTRVALACVAGTGMIVASANALNMWWERDHDALMERTRERPLASGRLSPHVALSFALLLAAASAPLLLVAGAIPFVAASASLVAYVIGYTPLKRVTPYALVVGAIAGATPPFIGYTAASGEIDAAVMLLFAIQLVWQLPHFAAIAIVRGDEYARGGYRVVRGESAKRVIVASSGLLFALTLLLPWTGLSGISTSSVAWAIGAAALVYTAFAPRSGDARAWAVRVYVGSIAYLMTLMSLLLVARALRGH
jgi:protoheme IX farnesyltransferase